MNLGWTPPSDDGGCPIKGYRLYRDTGVSDAISNPIDATLVQDRPTLAEYDVQFTSTDTGVQFRFQVEVWNDEGATKS